MESPTGFTGSTMEPDDVPFPCKGCGEILEEGKAFELAGNRWHIDCFRCSTCGTLLDSDAHLLLLGDGSLICSNCTYSCSSCGNKIEDLAILTGDQAFCANCFRCRNCKRRIENLRYARTSQGIFCMDCHESLMQRRRKKSRTATGNKKSTTGGIQLDKSLPSLPPNHDTSETSPRAGLESPGHVYSDFQANVSSRRPVQSPNKSDKSAQECSPLRQPANEENLLLPSTTYRSNRHSMIHLSGPESDVGGEFLIPVAFDPSEETPSPRQRLQSRSDTDSRERVKSISSKDGQDRLEEQFSRTQSLDQSSPNNKYPDNGRDGADIDSSRWRRDAPEISKSASTRSSRSDLRAYSQEPAPYSGASPQSSKSSEVPTKGSNKSETLQLAGQQTKTSASRQPHDVQDRSEDSVGSSGPASTPSVIQNLPKRGDSLENQARHQISRKEVPSSVVPPLSSQSDGRTERYAASAEALQSTAKEGVSKAGLSAKRADSDVSPLHIRNDSASTYHSDSQRMTGSPSLLRYNATGDFSMDEDMARIMGVDEQPATQTSESFLRRVSNSVRHGRSFSDKGHRLSKEAKWSKSSVNGTASAHDASIASPEQRDEIAWLKEELRIERQRVQERDRKIAEMEAVLNASAEVKQANTELHEKRSTMVNLDAQKEIALRELAVLTEHLEGEKRGASEPLDVEKLTIKVVRDFVERMQQLKQSFAPQVEELIQKRNQTADELANLNRMKDKSFQEFEQLSSKNAQLAELNNQLVHQIQGLYKASSGDNNRAANGLGIYAHNKDKSIASIELLKSANDLSSSISAANVHDDVEPVTVLPGPQVVNIRKGQVLKFNWKKGGQNVAKGVTKGLKGAFMSSEAKEPVPYNLNNAAYDGGQGLPRSQTQDSTRQGFGFFGNQRNKQAFSKSTTTETASNVSEPSGLGVPGLFGTDLEQRMEVEKSIIPAIVTRCIQEVELRGMDVEGIYRKSGASSQIQAIRDGFEKSHLEYDISDPDLDIHAVTSTLKQYFRKLPTPLITFDVYEKLIETNDSMAQPYRIDVLQKSLRQLPRSHRDVLEFLMFHLKRVVERERENLMSSQNIAVVFAPTIMRPESLAREMTDVQKKNDVLKFLVDNCQEVFMGMQDG